MNFFASTLTFSPAQQIQQTGTDMINYFTDATNWGLDSGIKIIASTVALSLIIMLFKK